MVVAIIESKYDYRYYLEADKIALKIPMEPIKYLKHYLINDIWRYERLLRKVEYFNNCKKIILWKPYVFYLRYKLLRKGIGIGFEIPLNVFGPGLSIAHHGLLIVNGNSKIGRNCRIHNGVHIGTEAGFTDHCPKIGDNVFIGPGAQIFGEITIADGIAIGANAVVNKSFLESDITIAGTPAKKISDKGSKQIYIRATDILDRRLTGQKP